MATPGQVRKIHAGAREAGLEREQLYDLVEARSGARSISRLTPAQAGAVIDVLVALGARPGASGKKPSGRRTAPGEIKLITGEVRDLIRDLREQLGGDWLREPYFEGACKRLLRKPRPTTGADGARVVEMLKQRLGHARRQTR